MNKTCKWCGTKIALRSHLWDECQYCWEMQRLIDSNPEIALLMVIKVIKALKHSLYPEER